MAFAVYIPNDASRANKDWKDPKDGLLKSVKELEEITHYNFFSNIPQEIQDAIKDRPVFDIVNRLNILSAPLMASDNTNLIDINRTLDNGVIGHSSVPEQNSRQISQITQVLGTNETRVSQDGIVQVGVKQISIPQDSVSQISSFQSATTQIGTSQIRTPQTSTSQISIAQVSSINPTTVEVSSNQASSTQISIIPGSTLQIRSHQIDSFKISSLQNDVPVINFNQGKISLPSTVTSEQFFSSNLLSRTDHLHTLTPESITTINNSAQTLWNTRIAPQTPFDINISLTDFLAKGQLAEAIVTKYDAQGRTIEVQH